MKKTIIAATLISLSFPVSAEYKIVFGNSSINLPEPPTVESQYALSFDGADDYVDITSTSATIDFPITVIAWTRDEGGLTGEANSIFDYGENERFYIGYSSEYRNTSNVYQFAIYDGSNKVITGTSDTKTNEWIHHAATVDSSGEMEYFINGVSQGTNNAGSIVTSGTTTFIGENSSFSGGNNNWNGLIDNVAIYDYALTQSEIQNNMDNELTGNETGLNTYYNLESGSGTTATDVAGSNDGIINGATWVEK